MVVPHIRSTSAEPSLPSWFMRHGMALCGGDKISNKSVFLVIKEIVDNAMDACRSHGWPGVDSSRVTVELINEGDITRFVCTDFGGPGITPEEVESIQNMFSSTKATGSGFSGKFGLGLKFVVIFLHQAGCGPIHFKIVSKDSKVVKFDLMVEGGGDAIRVGEVCVDDDMKQAVEFTTEVSVKLPSSPELTYDILLQSLREYLSLTSSFLTPPQATISFQCNGQKLAGLPSLKASAAHPVASYKLDCVTVAIRVRREPEMNCGTDRVVNVTRLVNSTAMMNLSGWTECCCLQALKEAIGGRMGDEFGIVKVGDEFREVGLLSCQLNCSVFPESPSTWGAIDVYINVESGGCQFGSLSKSSLAGFPPRNGGDHLPLLIAAITGGLRKIKNMGPGTFVSVADWNIKCASEIWAPMLCEMVGRVSDRNAQVPKMQKSLVDFLKRSSLRTKAGGGGRSAGG
ncbi:hypothetical protein FOL47_001421 [Perkinsus chesapeaki]|uniref:Histidine kinase/HSP90-like ATPase domain-containing protein n=1 Tax=Perkinsus chesapeaki TaxID=330153 RepID=A0A7J6MJI7_PERCH|nr:hypothetical protein FOL47_001421 [Perkinsus chesapeaki]